jgi:DNA-binding NarL/FixJ family response regulator
MHRTLIVDDIAVFRETFKKALAERFPALRIDEAVDGRDAMVKIGDNKPELIFMDIRLPGEDGLELTRRIKAQHPEIVIIVLTDHDLPEYRDAALQGGADDFIAKGELKMGRIEKLVARHMPGATEG